VGWGGINCIVEDPHHFGPNPSFHLEADLDPTFHSDADTDADPVPNQSDDNL
jgi:hypothetical protein